MSKKLIFILIGIALLLIIYNATLIDATSPFEGESIVAVIGIVAALCAIVLLLIYWTSKKIQKSLNEEGKK
ncbi:MAG: YdgA family protein [Bacteroidia bacterium]|nr:YdgA family protein [Bacteroidia bacterium]